MHSTVQPGSQTSICQVQRLIRRLCELLTDYCTASAEDRDTLALSLDDEIARLAELVRLLFYETRDDREDGIAEVAAEAGAW